MPRARSPRSRPAPRASARRRARAAGVRVVVVGAVEEEAATSKGARFIASRFDGDERADPDRVHHRRAEPLESRHARLQGPAAARLHRRSADGAHRGSGCERRRRSSSISGTGCTAHAAASTTARTRSFDQLSPSLRRFITSTNDADARHRRRAVRLAVAGRLRCRSVHAGARGTGRQANGPSGQQDDHVQLKFRG